MKKMKIAGIILVFCSFLFIGFGTYFAGFYALGGAIFVSGIILISAGVIIEELQSENNRTNDDDSEKRSDFSTKEGREQDILDNWDGWRCPNCGKVHYQYESTCSCGTRKPIG